MTVDSYYVESDYLFCEIRLDFFYEVIHCMFDVKQPYFQMNSDHLWPFNPRN